MTDHRSGRPDRSAGALLAGAGSVWCAGGRLWAPAALLTVGALALGTATVRRRRVRAQVLTERQRATSGRRSPLPAPEPCCRFWESSDGLAHHPDCRGAGSLAGEVERGWRELDDACCLHGWQSHGTAHDTVCAERTVA
ncbi:hypothetical protein ABZT03_22865 [Streptomyces sp. NPDC005574]|uniref:hypothetical protein n=1 Tax=Streptomyces sp. NPDC005574 TaxID=3156891 RepID=UPI0033AE096E